MALTKLSLFSSTSTIPVEYFVLVMEPQYGEQILSDSRLDSVPMSWERKSLSALDAEKPYSGI